MDWKIPSITAIYRLGKCCDSRSYRSISLTCIMCKLMETLVREEIMQHLNPNLLFIKKQLGFLSGWSTFLQLIKVMGKWTQILEEGDAVDVAYCDFIKAFGEVPHIRLLRKIKL